MTLTHSMRARLLWFLLAAITMAALAQASIAYRSALSDADEIFDYHMQQMALSLRSGAPLTNQQQAPAQRVRHHRHPRQLDLHFHSLGTM